MKFTRRPYVNETKLNVDQWEYVELLIYTEPRI